MTLVALAHVTLFKGHQCELGERRRIPSGSLCNRGGRRSRSIFTESYARCGSARGEGAVRLVCLSILRPVSSFAWRSRSGNPEAHPVVDGLSDTLPASEAVIVVKRVVNATIES